MLFSYKNSNAVHICPHNDTGIVMWAFGGLAAGPDVTSFHGAQNPWWSFSKDGSLT